MIFRLVLAECEQSLEGGDPLAESAGACLCQDRSEILLWAWLPLALRARREREAE